MSFYQIVPTENEKLRILWEDYDQKFVNLTLCLLNFPTEITKPGFLWEKCNQKLENPYSCQLIFSTETSKFYFLWEKSLYKKYMKINVLHLLVQKLKSCGKIDKEVFIYEKNFLPYLFCFLQDFFFLRQSGSL